MFRREGWTRIPADEHTRTPEGYRDKTDKELLRPALIPEQRTPEAIAVLACELAKRSNRWRSPSGCCPARGTQRKADNDKSLGTLGFIPHFGVGRLRFGTGDRSYDSEIGLERFKTIVFVVLFLFSPASKNRNSRLLEVSRLSGSSSDPLPKTGNAADPTGFAPAP